LQLLGQKEAVHSTVTEVKFVETTPVGNDEMGPIRAGKVCLNGPCLRAKPSALDFGGNSSVTYWDNTATYQPDYQKQIMLFQIFEVQLQYTFNLPTVGTLRAPDPEGERTLLYCLVVESIGFDEHGTGEELYKRVGVTHISKGTFRSLANALVNSSTQMSVTIV
jgi:hypothetical protein